MSDVTQITINKNLMITGLGASELAISGQEMHRVFQIDAGTMVSISGLTIKDGKLEGTSGTDSGPGILNKGTLSVSDSIFANNFTGGGGGAIGVAWGAQLTINRSTFAENFAGYGGGAISTDYSSTITVKDSVFSHNVAGSAAYSAQYGYTIGNGGAILGNAYGNLFISGSTFSDNTAYLRGGRGP